MARDEGVIEPAAGEFLQLGNHRGDCIEKAGVFGAKEAAGQAAGPQSKFAGGTSAKAFVHEHGIGGERGTEYPQRPGA